jgi:hypothetical protein
LLISTRKTKARVVGCIDGITGHAGSGMSKANRHRLASIDVG